MYTLEDDHETSSRLRRQRLIKAEGSQEPSAPQPGAEAVAQLPPADESTNGPKITRRLDDPSQSPGRPARSGRVSGGEAFAALCVACIAVFITALDQTVVVTALPQMITDLQLSITQLDHAAWIISAYLLGFVVAMPLMGRISDIYGRRRIFLLCLAIFGVSSLFCGLATQLGASFNLSFLGALGIDTSSPGLIWLVAVRLVQAVGGGALVPLAMAIAGDYYGQEKRGLALGIVGAVTEAGGAIGPLYGALIVDRLGWRYIFYLNVPIVVGLMIAAWFFIPRGKRSVGCKKQREHIDWLGAALLAASLTCLSLGLAQQGTALSPSVAHQTTPQNNPLALVLAVIFLALFVLVELKVRWPVIDLRTFRRVTFNASAWASLLVGAALIIAMSDIPIYVDTVLQGKALDSGLALLRLTVMIPVGAVLGGWLCNRLSCRVVGMLGLLFAAGGFFLMSRWPIIVDGTQMTVSTVTAGFGFGLVIAPLSTTAINAVRPSQAGMGSAIVTALRMVGMMLGLALLTSWALTYFKQLATLYPSAPANATPAQFAAWSQGYATHLIQAEHTVYNNVFFIAMIICLLGLLPAFFLWGRQAPVEEPAGFYDAPTVLVEEEEAEVLVPEKMGRWRRLPRRKRLLIVSCALLALLLIFGGIFSSWLFGEEVVYYDEINLATPFAVGNGTPTSVAASGPRLMQLVLDKGALTSLFASQLNIQNNLISDLSVEPQPDDGLLLSLKLNIDINGTQRVMPLEISGTISLDAQQNLQLSVQQLKRDGLVADADTTSSMQSALNTMLSDAVMPSLRGQLKNVKLLSVHTSTTISCAQGTETLVLAIEAPAVKGIAAQPTPVPFCFSGNVDITKLLPG